MDVWSAGYVVAHLLNSYFNHYVNKLTLESVARCGGVLLLKAIAHCSAWRLLVGRCILGELIRATPLLPGRDEISQLDVISRYGALCGAAYLK